MDRPFDADIAGMSHSELDDALRATELQTRALAAKRARILSAAAASGAHHVGGHRTISAYVRATCNTSRATSSKDHTLAKLVAAHPEIASSLEAGHISIDHAHEIARIHRNPRISHILDSILDSLLSMAEHLSLGEFRIQVGTIAGLADQDGAFKEQQNRVKNRRAWIDGLSGAVHLVASGGDSLTAAQLTAVFESFAEGELQADLTARKAEFGNQADAHPMPRTQSQRNFDALVAIFTAAAGSTQAGKLPDPTVNVIIDDATLQETLTHAGIALPNGNLIDLDEAGNPTQLLTDLVADLTENPEGLVDRVCNLSTGAAIHSSVVLQALLTGHIRRVVVDSSNVVTELGTRRRVFTGAAREAALLLTNFCTHPGCTIRSRHTQVDHGNHRRCAPQVPWSCSLGLTTPPSQDSQGNAQPRCGPHNRFKHKQRWQSKRDERGRPYNIRPDGTIVLPVGEREPDLTHDEVNELIRQRLHTLCTT